MVCMQTISYRLIKILTFLIVTITLLVAQYHFLTNTIIPNASAVETETGLEIYWDASCTRPVQSINWGILSPGNERNITIYIRNSRNESLILYIIPLNWNPEKALLFLDFSYTTQNYTIKPGEVAKVTHKLHVSPDIKEIYNFSFDLIFQGRKYPGDLNGDMTVDLRDICTIAIAYGSNPKHPKWNPYADLNRDKTIDILDIILAIKDYGKP